VKGETGILDNEEVLKRKERRKKRQREEISARLKNQGINLDAAEDDEQDLEGHYDTESEAKKEDGVTIEPFRMDGFFNGDGRYIERGDGENDPWYQQWKEQKENKNYQAPKVEDVEKKEETKDELSLREVLLKYVEPQESVIAAIKRLGKRKPGNKPGKKVKPWMKNKKRKITILSADGASDRRRSSDPTPLDTGEMKVEKSSESDMTKSEKQKADMDASGGAKKVTASEEESKRRAALEELTSAANELMSMGHHNVYQDRYENLTAFVKRAKAKAAKKTDAKEWEYRFNGEEKVYTGFTATQMQKWNKAGYFTNAKVHKIGTSTWMVCEKSFEFE